MSPASMMDYDSLKEVILKKYEISTETYRLRFRALDTPADETPMELYVRIKDLFSNGCDSMLQLKRTLWKL